jgi:hypothetical protein
VATSSEGRDAMEAELVESGRFVRIATRRSSGTRRTVTVGFVPESDGAILVAAGSPDAAWAADLLAEARAEVTVGDRSWPVEAEPLERVEAGRTVREMILRYGTPAESLGSGRAFRLRPADAG